MYEFFHRLLILPFYKNLFNPCSPELHSGPHGHGLFLCRKASARSVTLKLSGGRRLNLSTNPLYKALQKRIFYGDPYV